MPAGRAGGQAPGSMAMKLRALLLVLALSLAQPAAAGRKLLVFLLDGFRSDYISDEALESLPGFKEIVSRGVKVDYLTPDFPSLSYPNYYTLMTGEYCVLFWEAWGWWPESQQGTMSSWHRSLI